MNQPSDNKLLGVRFLELVGANDIEAILDLITPTWTMIGGPPGLPAGDAGIRVLFDSFGRIEQRWEINDVVADGDTVVVRATCAVEQDSFLGIPAAGRQQVFTATFTHYFAGGKINRTYRNADDLGRLLQLGVTLQAPVVVA